MQLDAETKQTISRQFRTIRSSFMKGTQVMPQCGFGATVIQILDENNARLPTVNVLAEPMMREGIKVFSNWPTIPQLYVEGEFVGGCDIVKDMHASGDLATKLGVTVEPMTPPSITVTDDAAAKLNEALSSAGEGVMLHLSINRFLSQHSSSDLALLQCDAESKHYAQLDQQIDVLKLTMCFKDPDGTGFKVDNPNAPSRLRIFLLLT